MSKDWKDQLDLDSIDLTKFNKATTNKTTRKMKEVAEFKGNIYHITFFKQKGDRYSTGVNIEAFSMIEALASFNKDYEGIDPFSIVEKTNYELIRVCNVCTDEII